MKSDERVVTYHEVIDLIGRMPTQRSEYFVLDFLLNRRQQFGTSLEKLYAGLLRCEFAATVAETEMDRRIRALRRRG